MTKTVTLSHHSPVCRLQPWLHGVSPVRSKGGASRFVNEHARSRSAKLIVYWTLTFQSNKRTYPMEEGGANSRREA